jgi:hypothetical protein
MWKPVKTNDYKLQDRLISEMFSVGGTAVLVHKYLGPHPQGDSEDLTLPNYEAEGGATERSIQDLLFLENRDRKYDDTVYELRGHYTLQDQDFDLTQFGLMLAGDTIFITLHLNDMIEMIGRKLMSGDVIELPHLRDDALLSDGENVEEAINRFYVVLDANRAAEGYGPTWYPHLWRLKCGPLHDAPEFRDILGTGEDPTDLKNFISTYKDEIGLSDAILEQAKAEIPQRNFETAHLYIVPGSDAAGQYPWIFAGDGQPPNGAEPVGSGARFPHNAAVGDYFLRVDYEPHVLFQRQDNRWVRIEADYREIWHSAHRLLQSFIGTPEKQDPGLTLQSGEKQAQRQDIRKAVKPRANL